MQIAPAQLEAHLRKGLRSLYAIHGDEPLLAQEAADMLPEFDHLDHLRLAIDDLPEEDQDIATDRFVEGSTLRTLAEDHQIPLRVASLRAQRLAKTLAEQLDIRLQPRTPERVCPERDSSRPPPGKKACDPRQGKRR